MKSGPRNSISTPRLTHIGETVHVLTDTALRQRAGIIVAFTERTGGHSHAPYDTLNLASHVGDDPLNVDRNRDEVMRALGIGHLRHDLVTAEQVHGTRVAHVDSENAGRGSHAASGLPPIEKTDALLTRTQDLPLMMLYADCVPIVFVTETPRAVAVVHAGWRGILSGIVADAAESIRQAAGVSPSDVAAYVGPHIGECCYSVDEELLSHFVNAFDTIAPAEGRLDLAMAVHESLVGCGLAEDRIVHAGLCTLDHGERFFSFRGSANTGRHGAVAVITKGA